MPYIILGISLLVGAALILRWFIGADPKVMAQALRIALAVVGVVVFLVLLVSGQLALALTVIGGLLPVIMRWRTLGRMARARRGPRPGQESTVETRFLRMSLDHDSGVMSGIVLEGAYQGRQLHELGLSALLDMLREFRVADPQSASVLEAYLDRTQAGDWRAAAAEMPGGEGGREGGTARDVGGAMTAEEAYRILGLEPGADTDAIKAAHRRLMRHVHPDRGGSNWIAAKINQAKDLLLKS